MYLGKEIRRRWRIFTPLALGLILGTLLVAPPAAGHFQASIAHIWKHIKPSADKRYVNNNEAVRVASTLGADVSLGDIVGTTSVAAPTQITAPKAGVIVATATFEADLGTCCGDAAVDLQFVRNGTNVGPVWRHAWAAAQELNAVTVQHVISVTKGVYTIGLRGTVADGYVNLDNPRVTLTYIRFGAGGGVASVAQRPTAHAPGRERGDR